MKLFSRKSLISAATGVALAASALTVPAFAADTTSTTSTSASASATASATTSTTTSKSKSASSSSSGFDKLFGLDEDSSGMDRFSAVVKFLGLIGTAIGALVTIASQVQKLIK